MLFISKKAGLMRYLYRGHSRVTPNGARSWIPCTYKDQHGTDHTEFQPCHNVSAFDLRDIACLIKHPSKPLFFFFFPLYNFPSASDGRHVVIACVPKPDLILFASTLASGTRREWLPLLQLQVQSRLRNVPHDPRPGVINRRRDGPRGSCPSFFLV